MTCVYPRCDRPAIVRGLCNRCYQRWQINPDTFPVDVRPTAAEWTGPYCTCETPDVVPVVLFGMTMTDVHECGRCAKPPTLIIDVLDEEYDS